jgi:hypothetical protein
MTIQHFDLTVSVDDNGTINLEQQASADTVSIHLHPSQLINVARTLAGNKPTVADHRVKALERRLLALCDKINDVRGMLPEEFIEKCGYASEFYAWLSAAEMIADELVADIEVTG